MKRRQAPALRGEALLDFGEELVGVEGFGEDGVGAEAARHAQEVGVADAAAAGDGEDLSLGPRAAQLEDGLDALLLRHDDVGDDEVGTFLVELRQRLDAVGGAAHGVARLLEDLPYRLAYDVI